MTFGKYGFEQRQPFRRGHQHPDIAVAQDVGDLLGFQQRIERHEDAARSRGAEAGDHRLETLFEVDGDALAALQPQSDQPPGELVDSLLQRSITERLLAVGQGNGARVALRRERNQVGKQRGIGHNSGHRSRHGNGHGVYDMVKYRIVRRLH